VKSAKFIAALLLTASATASVAQDNPADVEMWRLDCGTITLSDTAPFSDTNLYDGEERAMTDSCYLIRNGDQHMLWDAGLPSALKGTSATQWVFTLSLERTITEQLAELDLTPDDIDLIGISHYHDDHIGQAAEFSNATLLINRNEYEAVDAAGGASKVQLAPWFGDEKGEVRQFGFDHDVFKDGSVKILSMPGHTPGHSALLVDLPEAGPVMLTGDLYHFIEQIENKGVPTFNTDRADTLASFHRFNQMAENLEATVIIQHDPRHVGLLPAFPEAAK
jgi:glyoxylase-like metal-dependent hydrolase (beta-lactamase superfamily II)